MPKLKTLTFSPVKYSHEMEAPNQFLNRVVFRDWDDQITMNFSVRTTSPVVQVEDISVRMLEPERGDPIDPTTKFLETL